MPFWKCYYHIVWATRNRAPLIIPQFESIIYEAIRDKSTKLNCKIYAMNGVVDHVHVAVSIPPKVSVADWVGQVKGSSAHTVNQIFDPDPRFYWQEGYGVHTFGTRRLDFVVDYIIRQKDHHAIGNIHENLERAE